MLTLSNISKTVLIAMFTILPITHAQANEYYGKQKVVYHINFDDAKQQSSALRNIQNHINAVEPDNLDLRVVLHGNGLSLLVKPEALAHLPKFNHANATTEMRQKIDQLKLQGVQFEVCSNTLKGKNVNYSQDLYDVEDKHIVPSGVAELARLQQQGFTYIRP
ncbi:DsrE family protein [Thiomicrorhabdus cannonii]|uniref:DsrE family protein n=1 Tax=Thiomicrorhabdus cannonii TaxID=2748011 RepID=UPI0015BC9CCC|nr:DsrE family protein [Thiomicrorhabdus cannonii]